MNTYNIKLEKILDKEVIDIFIDIIHNENLIKRKPKYSIEYFLYHILLVLTDLKKWTSLKLVLHNDKDNHYSIIQKTHFKWCKKNIYKKVYNKLLEKYKLNNLKKSKNMVLYIDSTNIYNKRGIEKIGFGQNPKKKESRISLICDKFRNIYSLTLIDTYKKPNVNIDINQDIKNDTNKKTNKKINKKTNKKTNKKALLTLPNDCKTIKSSLDDLVLNNIKYKTLFLVGDSGYATRIENKKILHDEFNVKLAYPHKRNQKIKTPEKDKILLKDRYIVENTFAHLKNYSRICSRQDKLETTYMGFVFLAAIKHFKK